MKTIRLILTIIGLLNCQIAQAQTNDTFPSLSELINTISFKSQSIGYNDVKKLHSLFLAKSLLTFDESKTEFNASLLVKSYNRSENRYYWHDTDCCELNYSKVSSVPYKNYIEKIGDYWYFENGYRYRVAVEYDSYRPIGYGLSANTPIYDEYGFYKHDWRFYHVIRIAMVIPIEDPLYGKYKKDINTYYELMGSINVSTDEELGQYTVFDYPIQKQQYKNNWHRVFVNDGDYFAHFEFYFYQDPSMNSIKKLTLSDESRSGVTSFYPMLDFDRDSFN